MKRYVNYVLSILGLLFWMACAREEMKVSSGDSETVELSLQMGSRSGEGRTFLLSQENVNTINGIHIYLFEGKTEEAKCVQYKYLDYNSETESLRTSLKIDEGLNGKDLTVVVIGMSPNKDTYPLPEGELAVGSLLINDLSLRLSDGMSQKMKETEVFAGYKVFTGGTATVSVDLKRVVVGVICYITDIPAKIDEKNITSMELQLDGGQNTKLSLLPDFLSDEFTGKYGSEPNSGYVVLASHSLSEYSDSDNDGLLEINAQEESTNHPAIVADAVFFSAYLLPWQNIGNTESPLMLVLKSDGSAVKEYPVSLKDESGTVSKTYSLDMNQLYAIGAKPVAGSTDGDFPCHLPGESLEPGVHITASGWEETIEHDVDFPIFGIVVDELPKHLCKGDVVNVKVKGTTVAENYDFVFKPQSGHGENMNKSYKLNNGIYTIDSSDLVPGEYLVDIYNVIDGALGRPVNTDLKMVVHPVASKWIGGASGKEHDWNTWENWVEGTPYMCTDVWIPNGCAYYPELKSSADIIKETEWYEDNYCGKIQFDTKAQMKGLRYLKYEEGYVDLPPFEKDEVRLMFVPLNEVYVGDFVFSDYDNRNVIRPVGYEDCWPWLNEATYPITQDERIKSGFWHGVLGLDNSNNYYYRDAGDVLDFKDTPGNVKFRYLSDECNQKLRFPLRHETMSYFNNLPLVELKREKRNRFYDIGEYEANYIYTRSHSGDIGPNTTEAQSLIFTVGNIFMTGMSVKQFLLENSSVIESVQLINSELRGSELTDILNSNLEVPDINKILQKPISLADLNDEDVVIPHGTGFVVQIKGDDVKYKIKIKYTEAMEVWEK